ncbi:MAG: DUF1636 domain-containing protein [Pseudomonadota bacterium]
MPNISPLTTWVTICDTCKRDQTTPRQDGLTDGEALAIEIESLVKAQRASSDTNAEALVKTRRFSCLMGCSGACNVTIQAPGKLCYTLGKFEPSTEAAEGILAYAAAHAESETGQVPYRTWPQAIKGHFVTRHPPLPSVDPKAGAKDA